MADPRLSKKPKVFRKIRHLLFIPIFLIIVFSAIGVFLSVRQFLIEKSSYSRFHIYQK